MLKNIQNILLYNSGGGLGDSVYMIPLLQWLKNEFKVSKIYYIQNGYYKHFNLSLKEFSNPKIETIDYLQPGFAFFKFNKIKSYKNFKIAKEIHKNVGIKEFDLIIDTQTRFGNSLVIKSIPHKYYISPALRFLMSKPKRIILNSKHTVKRIFDYFENINNNKIEIPSVIQVLDKKYENEAERLFDNKKKYIGFSITAGHPTRKKEIPINAIIEVANYFSKKNYIPTFLIEEKYLDLINKIKNEVNSAFFPEHKADASLRNPFLVMAIGKKLYSAISINNGIMHMLGLSGVKMAIFFDEKKNYRKFRPLHLQKLKIYSPKNKALDHLSSSDIIKFIGDFF